MIKSGNICSIKNTPKFKLSCDRLCRQ